MREILILGRGGQGAQTAGQLLAKAFFAEGCYVQSYATYGGARRGTPVSAVIRIDEKPIRLRCDISKADAILCFDASLLDQRLLDRTGPDSLVVVNTARSLKDFQQQGNHRIFTIDGMKVSEENGMGRLINSALLGALSSVLNAPTMEGMSRTIVAAAPNRKQENLNAFQAGYRLMREVA